jgi:hypothetical protein
MNSYSTSTLINNNNNTTTSAIYSLAVYIILPIVIGSMIDILFTQHLGTQFCSFNKTEHECIIHGIQIKPWQRESVRCVLQLGVLLTILILTQFYFPTYMNQIYTNLLAFIGITFFINLQSDLFSDFRRLNNGILFTLKHN